MPINVSALPTNPEVQPVDVEPAANWSQCFEAIGAWLVLILVDILLKVGGFRRFHSVVREFPTVGAEPKDVTTSAQRTCDAVNRAATYYFKRAWCLQRAATATCLLRLSGVEAEMVIGAHKMPFYAHAWVEHQGKVLNDYPTVQERYTVLERC